MEQSYLAIFSLAFGLGMLHALDADHVMAVTSLAAGKKSFRASLQYCQRWAIGHGSVLLLVGVAVFLMGLVIPPALTHVAEVLVGVVLILIGIGVVIDIYRKPVHLHFHQHDNMPAHAHWHVHHTVIPHHEQSHHHQHKAVLFGMLHGLAGSAPVLALLPISQIQDPLKGLVYLLLFSLGSLFSMLVFGGLLGKSVNWLQKYGQKSIKTVRMIIGLTAIGFGAVWLQASF